MSRSRIALAFAVIAVALVLIAIVVRSRQPSNAVHSAIETRQPKNAITIRDKKPSNVLPGSGTALKDFITPQSESDRPQSSVPRQKNQQIKMH